MDANDMLVKINTTNEINQIGPQCMEKRVLATS